MPSEEIREIEPSVENIRLKGSLTGTFDAMANRIIPLQMFSLRATADGLTIVRVESRNIQKKPFLFMLFKFDKNGIEIGFSIGLDSSAKIRRVFVLKNLVSVLSLVADLYRVDDKELFQHLDSAMDELLNSMSQQYSTLFNQYDSLFNKYREIKRLNIELSNSNKNLSVQATLLSNENAELKSRLADLERYSDESLMSLVEDWIDSHDGTIDINEFSSNYKITPPRVEQVLNKLVSLGYIELKGA